MAPVSGWTAAASYGAPQRWAQPDRDDAARKLRAVVARHADFLEAAALASEAIANRYAEPLIACTLIAALDG